MRYIIFFLLIVLIINPIHSKEFSFPDNPYYKKVIVDGNVYRLIKPNQINILKYKDLYQLKKELTNASRQFFKYTYIITTENGTLIRDVSTIQKALFTQLYSQLSGEDIEEFNNLTKSTMNKIDEASTDLSKTHYFNSIEPILYLIHKNYLLDDDFTNYSKKSLYLFLKQILQNPKDGFKSTLSEILMNCKNLMNNALKLIKTKQGEIVSYDEALDMNRLRLGLAYTSAVIEYINDNSDDSFGDFITANKQCESIRKKYSDKITFKTFRHISKNHFIKLIKSFYQNIYQNEEPFKNLLYVVQESNNKVYINTDYFKKTAIQSASYLPYYKSNYKKYSIPLDIQKKYKKTLFYEDFSDDLDRWNIPTKLKPQIIKKWLKINGKNWQYSAISSKVYFNSQGGDLYIVAKGIVGDGKGSFGFGEKIYGSYTQKKALPYVGFLFNNDIDGSNNIDFRINNELMDSQLKVYTELSRIHVFKLILHQKGGVSFYIDEKKVYYHPFQTNSYGSESIILSSKGTNSRWKEIIVYQKNNNN